MPRHSEDVDFERTYSHPKPAAVTSALFAWEGVASFSQPEVVVEIEHVCFDISELLRRSNQKTNVMQRYWFARCTELTWEGEEGTESVLSDDKKFLRPQCMTRSQGNVKWKQNFAELYVSWRQRCARFSRKNEVRSRPVDTGSEALNPRMTASQLKAVELTAEESERKMIQLLQTSGDEVSEAKRESIHRNIQKMGKNSTTSERDKCRKDPRYADRAGKHKKGAAKTWSDEM